MATSLPKRTIPQFTLTHKVPVTIIRQDGEGDYVKGVWVPPSTVEITVEANVQPLKGSELLALPESDRTSDTIKVYSVETLKTVDEYGQSHADLIVWNGKKYKALKTQTYQMGVLDHTKTICARLPLTPQDKATV